MKLSTRLPFSLSIAALGAFMLGAADAETYEGVLQFQSQRDRSGVQAEAVAAAHAPDQNVVPGSRGPLPFTPMAARRDVQAQAIAAAQAPDQNVVPGSRVNSQVISTMPARQVTVTAAEQR